MTTTLHSSPTAQQATLAPLVWLPFEPTPNAPLPLGLRYVIGDPTATVPGDIAEVELLVIHTPGVPQLEELVAQMPKLRIVQTLSAGVDGLMARLPAGVQLCNARGVHDAATAEHAVAMTLAMQRNMHTFVDAQRAGSWAPAMAPGLADLRIMILGYGSVGSAIEARLSGYEAEVVRVARVAREAVHAMAELDSLLPTVDIVIVIVPLTSATRGMVNSAFLDKMKDGALLVNVARGAVVVTQDLIDACASGRIRAAVDVTDPEPLTPEHAMWSTPNLLITPHVGGWTQAMQPRVQGFLRAQLERLDAGEPLANPVNGEY